MVGYLLIGRTLRLRLGSISYSTSVYAVCGIALLLAAWLSGASLLAPPHDVPLFLAPCTFPNDLWTHRLQLDPTDLPASVVSTAFLGELIGASLLAWLFLARSRQRRPCSVEA